jgi:hypothetical protein
MKPAFLALSLLIGVVLLIQTRCRGIDPDELEHIHAACAVSWGELPYRDFFEHHAPGLYYLLQPIIHMTGTELPALWWSRLLMWFAGIATLALTAAIANRLAGKTAAAVAPALLGCTTIFFWKAIEVRPDVPAMFLLTLAAYVAIASRTRCSGLAAVLIGFLLGLATLFTQKAIAPAAALILSQFVCQIANRVPLLRRSSARRNEPLDNTAACERVATHGNEQCDLRHCFLIALGGATPWLIASALFSTVGAADAFLHATVYQLWLWPVRQNPLTALRPTLCADLPLWLGAALAIVASVQGRCTATTQPDGRSVLSLMVLLCFVFGLLVKAAYAQYYLLWFPWAAIVAADSLVRLASEAVTSRRRWAFFGVLALLVAIEAALAGHAVYRGVDGPLPHLLDRVSAIAVGSLAAGFILVLAVAATVFLLRSRQAAAIVCLAVLGFGYAGLRNLDARCWSNLAQVKTLATVDRLVAPNETVLDGFTGFGAFRRHAYYYWWLNPYSLGLMDARPHEPGLLATLKQSPPKLICVDENVRKLPASVLAWIDENYAPLDSPLYLRKTSVMGPVRGRGD